MNEIRLITALCHAHCRGTCAGVKPGDKVYFNGAEYNHPACAGPCRTCGENFAVSLGEGRGYASCTMCYEVESRLTQYARSTNGKAKLREALNPPGFRFTAYAVGRLVVRDGAVVLDGIGIFSEPSPTVPRSAALVVLCDDAAATLEEASERCRSRLLHTYPWAKDYLRERGQ